jgi:hypothetical protein
LPGGEEETVQQVATATPVVADATPDPTPDAVYDYMTKVLEDQKKPPFIGDRLGIFIVGTHDQEVDVPAQYVTAEDVCPNGTSLMRWDQAGELALPAELPPEYRFLPDNPDTGVFGCNGVISSVKRVYRRVYERGLGSDIHIGRWRTTVRCCTFVAADRVKVVTIGGREAVLVEPVYPEGTEPGGTHTEIIFPEPFGMTEIWTLGLPLAETLQIGEIVAEATKQP